MSMNENRTTEPSRLHPSMTTGKHPRITIHVHLSRKSFGLDGGCELAIVLPSGHELVVPGRHSTVEAASAAGTELNYALVRILQGAGFKVFGPELCVECGFRYVPDDDDQGLELCASCWNALDQSSAAEASV